MKTKFVVIASLLLAWVHWCTAATLVSVININRNGGTATGAFVGGALPGFLLNASQGRFTIRNSGGTTGSQWEFLLDHQGETPLLVTPTIDLAKVSSFSAGPVRIFENDIPLSADRFNPDPVYYLIGRVGTFYHAFQVARWASGPVDRLRFYGTEEMTETASGSISAIPEPGAASFGLLGAALLLIRRRG